jgi:hypothetical protein
MRSYWMKVDPKSKGGYPYITEKTQGDPKWQRQTWSTVFIAKEHGGLLAITRN